MIEKMMPGAESQAAEFTHLVVVMLSYVMLRLMLRLMLMLMLSR